MAVAETQVTAERIIPQWDSLRDSHSALTAAVGQFEPNNLGQTNGTEIEQEPANRVERAAIYARETEAVVQIAEQVVTVIQHPMDWQPLIQQLSGEGAEKQLKITRTIFHAMKTLEQLAQLWLKESRIATGGIPKPLHGRFRAIIQTVEKLKGRLEQSLAITKKQQIEFQALLLGRVAKRRPLTTDEKMLLLEAAKTDVPVHFTLSVQNVDWYGNYGV